MTTTLTEEEFAAILRSGWEHEMWRWECQPAYKLSFERDDFDLFLAGQPVPPPQIEWWREWLDQVAAQTGEGKTVARTRVLDDEPTAYQRWMKWAHPWYDEAGERIQYMSRAQAAELGLPLGVDWWLLDDTQVIAMYFTGDGQIAGKILITDPGIVAVHRAWRDLAVQNATAAEEIRAA